MKKKNNKKNTRRTIKKENKLKQKILEINLSKATIITSIIVIIVIALITAGIIKTINESSKEKVEVEEGEEYSPVNWIESTEIGEDGNYKKVPVPKGYVASQIEGETTVNGGFVIYEDNYNGKSINWDEIIIKDDSSGASGVSTDEGKEEETTLTLETLETLEVTPTEDKPTDETAMTPENVEDNGEQEEQGESVENNESQVNEENPIVQEEEQVEETKTNREESSTSEEASQEENGIPLQSEEIATEGKEPTEPVEPEVSTAEQQTKKNIFELQKSVNQYVWVPVPDINRICGVDANGKLWGKLYSFNSSGATPLNWTEINGKMTISSKTIYREPDVTYANTNYDIDRDMKRYMYGETQYEMLTREMEQNFYETMKSIEKYGGYYIGRYETGIEERTYNNKTNGGNTVVRKMQYDDYSINFQSWYEAYKKNKELSGSNKNIKTSMICGSLWDETLKWLVETGATTTGKEGVASQTITYSLINSSTSWGNHYDSGPFNYIPDGAEEPETTATKVVSTSTRIPTGSAEYTKVNNIYDMAGNLLEWTSEAYSRNYKIRRGGCYDLFSSNTSVHIRYKKGSTYASNGFPDNSSSNYGSRAILTIR